MNTRAHKLDSLVIVYDADRIQQPDECLFDPQYWEQQGSLVGTAEGRGSAFFLETPFAPAVLKQYLRGGWPARISRDRYFFTTFSQSRPLAEFRILDQMASAGLPVPEPLAAMCRREGLYYTGWLMTRRLMAVKPLADLMADRSEETSLWKETGAAIQRFHQDGVVHADLNARNILVDENDAIYLIDFDRARISNDDSRAFQANLSRLHRSLRKLWPESRRIRLDACWEAVLDGYNSAAGAR